MPLTAPDWLSRRDCGLRPAPDDCSVAVLLNGEPQYLLTPVPAGGKHSCRVMQTNNGKRLDAGTIYSSTDEVAARRTGRIAEGARLVE